MTLSPPPAMLHFFYTYGSYGTTLTLCRQSGWGTCQPCLLRCRERQSAWPQCLWLSSGTLTGFCCAVGGCVAHPYREEREKEEERRREEGREGGRSKFSYFVVSARGKDKPTNYTEYLHYSWRVQCNRSKMHSHSYFKQTERRKERGRETAKVGKEVTRYTVPVYGEQLRV